MRTIENIEIENGMKLWAYTCRKVGSSYTAIKPYLGVIVGSSFCPIGKNGELRKSGEVSRHLRKYSVSEETAIENYNKELDMIVQFHEDEAKRYRTMRL